MTFRWLRDKLTVRHYRAVLCDQILALDPLPEAERMTTRPMLTARPRTFAEWIAKYGRKRA